MPGYNSQRRGTACTLPQLIVLFCAVFVCKCALYFCHRVTTQLQLTNISYHITLLAPVFWDDSKIFGKCVHPWPTPNLDRVRGTNGETGSVLHYLHYTAWELSVDEGIMPYGTLGTVLHGYESNIYIISWSTGTVWFQRMFWIGQKLSNNTLRTHCSKPQVEAAITNDFFLVTGTSTMTSYSASSWGREYGNHWISQVSLFDVHLNIYVEVSCIDDLAYVKCDHKEWNAE